MHYGNVHNCLFRHGKRRSQHMEKQRAAFPRPANSVSHNSMSKAVIHISTMPTATTKTAPSLSFIRAKNLKGGITIRNVNIGYMIRAPTPRRSTQRQKPHPLQLNTAAPQTLRRCGEPAQPGGLMTAAVTKTDRRFLCPFSGSRTRGKKGELYGIFYFRSRRFENSCYRSWSRAWYLGRCQPHGGLRQRQSGRECSWSIKKQG